MATTWMDGLRARQFCAWGPHLTCASNRWFWPQRAELGEDAEPPLALHERRPKLWRWGATSLRLSARAEDLGLAREVRAIPVLHPAMAALKQPCGLPSRPPLLWRCRPGALRGSAPKGMPAVCALEDFDFREGPREVTKPKFIRSEYPSLAEPVKSGDAAPGASKRRGRRPFRKATPVQAISGAVIGGGCSVVAFEATRRAYQHLETHPPAHDLPMNLTSEVNQFMLTMVAGFGGLVVCMFGVSCVGLVLLSVQLIRAPKPPPSAP